LFGINRARVAGFGGGGTMKGGCLPVPGKVSESREKKKGGFFLSKINHHFEDRGGTKKGGSLGRLGVRRVVGEGVEQEIASTGRGSGEWF